MKHNIKKKTQCFITVFGQFLFLKSILEALKAGWGVWQDCGLGFWWFLLLRRHMHSGGPLLLWPAELKPRGTQARLGLLPEQTQPLHTAKGNSPGSILARAEWARGMQGSSPTASGREGERERWTQERTGAFDVIGPTSFCMGGETEAWRRRGRAWGHSMDGGIAIRRILIHVSFLFLWGFLLSPCAAGRQQKLGVLAVRIPVPALPGSAVSLWDVPALLQPPSPFISKILSPCKL